jgi:putative endonuclease
VTAASTTSKGRAGEDLATAFLEDRGWSILERNFRSRWGEIDIVASREGEVAFIEVKSWRTMAQGELEHSVTRAKRSRIIRTARAFLQGRRDLCEQRLRFDILFLGGGGRGMIHIENAFDAGGMD